MIETGLDRLLAQPRRLRGRAYGLLCHQAAVSARLEPIHLVLAALEGGRPRLLFVPEHGLYGIEQDMEPSAERGDPATGLPILSLYADSEESLRPPRGAWRDLDLLVVDLQDVGARYYTFAASAVWAAEAALEAGCEVWVLDRPNPLGGSEVEGPLLESGMESFVGAFRLPVRHGLTIGELFLLEAARRGWPQEGLEVWRMEGWCRSMRWPETGRPWIAPSPNMPTFTTAEVYPGSCLVEATELSEGRGTTRPFQLIGAPGIDAQALAAALNALALPGARLLPTRFRPEFQKHAGSRCGGVEVVVTDADAFRPFRFGLELLQAVKSVAPESFAWRRAPYEFVDDRPAIDLLTGSDHCRRRLDELEPMSDWIASFAADEETFRQERQPVLLYR